MGIARRPASRIPVTDQCRSSQVAALSPVQWAAQPPEPTNVLRVSTNGLRLPAATSQAVASLSHSYAGGSKQARRGTASALRLVNPPEERLCQTSMKV